MLLFEVCVLIVCVNVVVINDFGLMYVVVVLCWLFVVLYGLIDLCYIFLLLELVKV